VYSYIAGSKINNLVTKSLRMSTIYLGMPVLLVIMTIFNSFNYSSYAFGSSNFNFAAAGDFGCNGNTEDTIDNIVDKDPELVLGLGDYSYKTSIQCWLDLLEPIDKQIVKISIGNHEAFSNSRTSLSQNEFDKLMEYFNLTTQYHSFNHENVHFLSMSTELRNLQEEKKQFNFVNKDLSNASVDPKIDWIIVFFHKPFYALPTKHHGPEETKGLKDIYLPLFEKYNVNLVLQGHNHNYERSIPDEYSRGSEGEREIVYVVVGTAGAPLHDFVSDNNARHHPDVRYKGFGFLNVEVIGEEMLKAQFYPNNKNEVQDEFTIRKNNN
jgi:hypothetical protein